MKNLIMISAVCLMLLATVTEAIGQDNQSGKSDIKENSLPVKFDLRDRAMVTPVKQQSGGTCWTHGTMSAIESNMLVSGLWLRTNHEGMPNMTEYHLDWWNGFNKFENNDIESSQDDETGMRVHSGGDYRVAVAYISRGDGVVYSSEANDNDRRDAKWYRETPEKNGPDYEKFYVRDVEWFTIGDNLENIETVKRRLMEFGGMGTCYASGRGTLKNNIHYQPIAARGNPNHSVAIVGWDDTIMDPNDKLPEPGAWLIKNSWGTNRGNNGYYWISYYDKYCCRHPEMGAVSFRNIEPLKYNQFYYHDYHGWRASLKDISRAFNVFTATGYHSIQAASFYTSTDDVQYTIKIFDRFEDGLLLDELSGKKGFVRFTGFHTVDLDKSVDMLKDDTFYVYLELSRGGQAIDRTSFIPVLLGDKEIGFQEKPTGPIVKSTANAGESYYYDGSGWRDLYEYDFDDPDWGVFDHTANFCIKALGVEKY